MKRKTRAQAKAANRAALQEAARRHFERHGFHGASLDAIADGAGLSKGAVYSRFASKDDLFLAVLEDHIEHRAAGSAAQLAELDDRADMRALLHASIRTSVATVAWQAALLEFRAHAWRNPALNARYAALHRRALHGIAGHIAEAYRRRGEIPPIPVGQLARSVLAHNTGVVAEYMADPDVDLDTLIETTSAGIAGPLP